MINIAILSSGSGTNAENIVRYFMGSKLVHISLVMTENPYAYVIKRMEKLRIPTVVFTMEELRSDSVLEVLNESRIDFIVLAGFLKLIPNHLLKAYSGRIVNIHPALLPKYGGRGMYGSRVHEAVLAAGEDESGITIHMVNAEYDEGEIIFQAKCPVMPCDGPETLAERIHTLEYEHYPRVIERLVASI